jgi:hypothetical protein
MLVLEVDTFCPTLALDWSTSTFVLMHMLNVSVYLLIWYGLRNFMPGHANSMKYLPTAEWRTVARFVQGLKFWAHTQFGPETALARHSLRPGNTSPRNTSARKYFSLEILRPETTSAQRILRPSYILRPGNNFGPENTSARLYTSAQKYFGPIDFGPLHFGPGTKLSKVSLFNIFDLP